MFFEIAFFVSFGIFLGLLTGLIPGLHPNTIFVMVLPFVFLHNLSAPVMLAFVVSLAVSNTLFDFIPSIFFGVPEEDSVLSILPGHKFLLEGRGYEALFLTVVGGVGVVLLTILALPFLLFILPKIFETT